MTDYTARCLSLNAMLLNLTIVSNVQASRASTKLFVMAPFGTVSGTMYPDSVYDNDPRLLCRNKGHQRLVNTVRYAAIIVNFEERHAKKGRGLQVGELKLLLSCPLPKVFHRPRSPLDLRHRPLPDPRRPEDHHPHPPSSQHRCHCPQNHPPHRCQPRIPDHQQFSPVSSP